MASRTGRGFETTTGLVIKQGIFAEAASENHKVGTRMQLADGRVFYYAKAGGSMAAGKLSISVPPTANHTNQTGSGVAGAANAKSLTMNVGATAVTANQYAEGWVCVNDASGEGFMYKIKSHPACSASSTVTLTLYDPINTLLVASTSELTLIQNPFMDVTQSATEESIPAGIPSIAITDNYYFWLQTWGYAMCLRGDTAGLGSILRPDSTAGEVCGQTATNDIQITMPLVGISAVAGVDGEYYPILLQIHP